jgi:hypothetical protein
MMQAFKQADGLCHPRRVLCTWPSYPAGARASVSEAIETTRIHHVAGVTVDRIGEGPASPPSLQSAQARRSWGGWTGPLRFCTLRAPLRHDVDRQMRLAQRGDEVLRDRVPPAGSQAVDPVVVRTVPQSGDRGLIHGCAPPSPGGEEGDGDRAWRSRRRYSSKRPRSS